MKTKILTALNNANDAPRASAHPTFGASYGLLSARKTMNLIIIVNKRGAVSTILHPL